jgi:hypothetical protein
MPRVKKASPEQPVITIEDLIRRLKMVRRLYPDLGPAVDQVILGLEALQHRIEPMKPPPPPIDLNCGVNIFMKPPQNGNCKYDSE